MNVFSFLKKRPDLRAVIDVGSHTTKAVIFEVPRPDKNGLLMPRVGKKMVLQLPLLYKEDRVITKLREFTFAVVKELERVPEAITVAFGPELIGASLESWQAKLSPGEKGVFSKAKVRDYFDTALETQRKKQDTILALPNSLFVNGYAVGWKEPSCCYFPQRVEEARENSRDFTLFSLPRYIQKYVPAGSEIRFSTFVLRPSGEIHTALEHMRQSLGGMPIEFIPLVVAQKEAIVHACAVSDALAVDVGGEETVLVLIKGGSIAAFTTFPVGARHFLRGMSKVIGLTFEQVEDLKRQYEQGLISERKKEQLHSFLGQESDLWKRKFVESLSEFYQYGPLPETIFLFGGGARVPEIQTVVRSTGWLQGFSYVDKPILRVLEAPRLFQGDSLGGFLQGPEEVGLASLMVYSLCHESLF